MISCIQLFATPWTVSCLAPLSMAFSRQEYYIGLLVPPSGDLPDSGIKPISNEFPALSGGFFYHWATWKVLYLLRRLKLLKKFLNLIFFFYLRHKKAMKECHSKRKKKWVILKFEFKSTRVLNSQSNHIHWILKSVKFLQERTDHVTFFNFGRA